MTGGVTGGNLSGSGGAVAGGSESGSGGAAGTGAGACEPGMVRIAAKDQSFMMGFTAAEAGKEWACFIGKHQVTFTYDFCVDANLVTQEDYLKLAGNNPSKHVTGDMTPT